MKYNKLLFILGIIIFILIIVYSYTSQVTEYIGDAIISIAIITIVLFLRKHLNLTSSTFLLLILALTLHNLGVFGFYNISPLKVQYDHITHFVWLFPVSLIVFNFFKPYFSNNKLKNLLLLLFILTSSLGVGALIEQTEYIGYLKFGTGPGLLRFGGLGDTFNEENLRAMDIIGGGWINTMLDLNYNFLGALFGVILMYFTSLIYKNGRPKTMWNLWKKK